MPQPCTSCGYNRFGPAPQQCRQPAGHPPPDSYPRVELTRDATQAEKSIARAWVGKHRWANPAEAEVEYQHALTILVFGNARPPLKPLRVRSSR